MRLFVELNVTLRRVDFRLPCGAGAAFQRPLEPSSEPHSKQSDRPCRPASASYCDVFCMPQCLCVRTVYRHLLLLFDWVWLWQRDEFQSASIHVQFSVYVSQTEILCTFVFSRGLLMFSLVITVGRGGGGGGRGGGGTGRKEGGEIWRVVGWWRW